MPCGSDIGHDSTESMIVPAIVPHDSDFGTIVPCDSDNGTIVGTIASHVTRVGAFGQLCHSIVTMAR